MEKMREETRLMQAVPREGSGEMRAGTSCGRRTGGGAAGGKHCEEAILSAERLSAGYGGRAVLHEISFSVQAGEIFTLIGPNGAGKSTLLRTLSAQLRPSSGAVLLAGRALSSLGERERARRLALLPTRHPEPEYMSCREAVQSGRYPYTGMLGLLSAEDRAVAENAMRLVGVETLAERDFRALSDGQRQRVLLAKAVCQEPELLLLDEPTAYLDISHKLELLELLRKLSRDKGMTVVLSLHELELAEHISDRILCMREGRAERVGTPEEIFFGDYLRGLYDIREGSWLYAYAGKTAGLRVAGIPLTEQKAER
ncbi:iron complex transport system ATP-binding protein/cobalt-precorrin-5B (C1)-methyltransferase [Fusobacterium naviforme]|nr:ABC transporter ATP-binding protein [Fusobacterium naviforme]PSL11516.1 iron complex transport system ATP-binding protein/cobalt-precorrin-5B (C1)-methyltransferase [Fusobacterium naviforme]STO26597.1 Probable siderophore transport system ATP-binding protein YusV [Fusobacterium naviforme]